MQTAARNYFATTRRLMHSKLIDSSSPELRIGYIMPNTAGEHIELRIKKLRLNADLKFRTSEVKYLEMYSLEECKRIAEYYLSENLTKEVLDHIHHHANFGTLALKFRSVWQRFKANFLNQKIRVKLSSVKKATKFVHTLISLHRQRLQQSGVKKYNEFILCGQHQAFAFEAVIGFRFANAISKLSQPFGSLFLLGSVQDVEIFVDPNFKSDYIIIGHRPNDEVDGTVAVHTERTFMTTENSVSAKMMVGFVDFGRQTEYHAVAIQAQSVYF